MSAARGDMQLRHFFENGIPVTVWLDYAFEVEAEPPFQPIGIVQRDGLHLTIRSMFELAGKVKGTSDLGHRWHELLRAAMVEIPGIGHHELQPSKWFVHGVPAIGTAEDLADAIADTGSIFWSSCARLSPYRWTRAEAGRGSVSPRPDDALPPNDSTGVAFVVVDERLCHEQAQDDDGRHACIDREDRAEKVPRARDRSDL